MANPVSGVSNARAAAKVEESQAPQTAKKSAADKAGRAEDTVNISPAGRAASQAQAQANGQKTVSDADHDGH
jgi:hypothetical protein